MGDGGRSHACAMSRTIGFISEELCMIVVTIELTRRSSIQSGSGKPHLGEGEGEGEGEG